MAELIVFPNTDHNPLSHDFDTQLWDMNVIEYMLYVNRKRICQFLNNYSMLNFKFYESHCHSLERFFYHIHQHMKSDQPFNADKDQLYRMAQKIFAGLSLDQIKAHLNACAVYYPLTSQEQTITIHDVVTDALAQTYVLRDDWVYDYLANQQGIVFEHRIQDRIKARYQLTDCLLDTYQQSQSGDPFPVDVLMTQIYTGILFMFGGYYSDQLRQAEKQFKKYLNKAKKQIQPLAQTS